MSLKEYFKSSYKIIEQEYNSDLASKYKPTYNEIKNNYPCLKPFTNWINDISLNRNNIKHMIIYGTYGCGKTTLLRTIIKHYNIEYIYYDISKKKSSHEINSYFHNIKNYKRYIFFIDDIDEILKRDNIKLSDLQKWIETIKKESGINIILTLHYTNINKFTSIIEKENSIQIIQINPNLMYNKCLEILDNEKISYTTNELKYLKELIIKNDSDIRSIINSLEYLTISISKDKTYDVYQLYNKLLTNKYSIKEKMFFFSYEPGTIPTLIQENYLDWNISIEQKCNIAKSMAIGDIFHKHLYNANSSYDVDMYGVYSSIFHNIKIDNKKPKFGLIWTKQSTMYQKRKYIKQVDSDILPLILSHKSLYYLYLMLYNYIINTKNIDNTEFFKHYKFSEDVFFSIKNSFSFDVKNITKKSFYIKIKKFIK